MPTFAPRLAPVRGRVVAAALAVLGLSAWARAQTLDGPLTPAEAPKSFRLEPGLRLELVASEPLVVSPVALAFDERGRLFVAENRGYPTGPGPGEPPAGRLALLEDADGDGRMDRRTEFADGLTFPNGVLPWDGGVIVTCAPDVLFLRDTDGDGKADERTVLFTGFATTGSTQLRVSHPTLSVDNWAYLTSGLTGGKVVSPSAPGREPVTLKRTDLRFRPGGDAWEAADGGAQFGMTFDDFGRRFICYNRVQVQHVVISSAALKRNPHLAFSETVQNCPADTVAEPLKGHGAAARIFPISNNVTTADSHAGTFTAACGVTVFRGTGLPDAYRGGAFSCDPTGNLVHFDRLEPDGATFAARRAREDTEFLASSDSWFRPVFLAHGPDGALYVADMYRKTIEHPDYLPVEIRKRTDFSGGKGMGRVWRVVRDDDGSARRRRVDLASASVETLCRTLRDPDGWWRDTAHRLLLARKDRAAVAPLKALADDAKAPAAAVAQALYLLSALGDLPDDLLRRATAHASAGVREVALRLLEPVMGDLTVAGDAGPSSAGRNFEAVAARADDADARVRFQAALDLGALKGGDDRVVGPLAAVAVRGASDRWTRAAVFSALDDPQGRRVLGFVTALRVAAPAPGAAPAPPELYTELGRLVGSSLPRDRWEAAAAEFVSGAGDRPFPRDEQAALLTGLAGAARGALGPEGKRGVLTALFGDPAAPDAGTARDVRDLVTEMTRVARDASADVDRRRAAVGLLAFADYGIVGDALLGLLEPGQPAAVQAATARALGAQRDDRVTEALMSPARFSAYTPALRDEALAAVVSQPDRIPQLLSLLESGRVPKGAVDALRRRQLSQSRDEDVKRRALALFGAVEGDRAKVYEDYRSVVDLPSDPGRGRTVFKRECSQCHRLDQDGVAVGPDLFGVRNQPKAAILLHVLVPDQEITQGFAAYTVSTKDGRVMTGLIASESPSSITLRQPLGKEDTVLRAEIDELTAGAQSLMPQGLEKNIARQEFADLLAYLKGEGGAR